MSGIYIPGIEMPITCCHCAFMYYDPDAENSNNGNLGSYICSFTKEEIWNTQRCSDCPLVPVPYHGRLIDAKALSRMFDPFEICGAAVLEIIADMPTIIPADKEEQT